MAEAEPFGKRIKPLPVVDAAKLANLRFMVAYMPERNAELGAAVASIALACDQGDRLNRS